MVDKLAIPFSSPGGIRVDDVAGVNDSEAAISFKDAVVIYGRDKDHGDRVQTLLAMGKMSMEAWQQMYDEGDAELKGVLEASNFNPCREPRNGEIRSLHDGYRIDLIYGIPEAEKHAGSMLASYEKLGYKHCQILSPAEVTGIDPYLADFVQAHSVADSAMTRRWNDDSVALWRPGGCIDARMFLPKLYAYLKKVMGQYKSASGHTEDCFSINFNSEVTGLEFNDKADSLRISGLKFADGSIKGDDGYADARYIFCPGEAVGTLKALSFDEPSCAAFAGPSLLLNVPMSAAQADKYKNFSHCMEVHNEGIVLAWQARFNEGEINISVAGTKAFYGDRLPNKDETFARNRNLVQLNMVNNVLPECMSWALGYNTAGKELGTADLKVLEDKGLAERWVGRRAVAYDGFPTLGQLYCNQRKVDNARCTTHLGSGGVSFGPIAVQVSRSTEKNSRDAFVDKVLRYADSRRTAGGG